MKWNELVLQGYLYRYWKEMPFVSHPVENASPLHEGSLHDVQTRELVTTEFFLFHVKLYASLVEWHRQVAALIEVRVTEAHKSENANVSLTWKSEWKEKGIGFVYVLAYRPIVSQLPDFTGFQQIKKVLLYYTWQKVSVHVTY